MALSGVVRVQVPCDVVFPQGAQVLGVEPELDFDARKEGKEDDQKRDPDTGERVWSVRVVDLDPEALKFGGSAEAKVRITTEHQPVPPKRSDPRLPPLVEFEGLTMTPYVNAKRCKDGKPGDRRDCGCRVGFSLRATGMVAVGSTPSSESQTGTNGRGKTTTAAGSSGGER